MQQTAESAQTHSIPIRATLILRGRSEHRKKKNVLSEEFLAQKLSPPAWLFKLILDQHCLGKIGCEPQMQATCIILNFLEGILRSSKKRQMKFILNSIFYLTQYI